MAVIRNRDKVTNYVSIFRICHNLWQSQFVRGQNTTSQINAISARGYTHKYLKHARIVIGPSSYGFIDIS